MLGSIMFSLVVIGLMFWCGRVTANFAAEAEPLLLLLL